MIKKVCNKKYKKYENKNKREKIVFLEKGKYNPSLKLAYQIAKILNTKIEDLFEFEEEDFN